MLTVSSRTSSTRKPIIIVFSNDAKSKRLVRSHTFDSKLELGNA